MPWDRSAPTDPKYRTREHKAERAKYVAQMKRDGYLVCAQPVCVMSSRTIGHGEAWHLGHDDSGRHYIGPTHRQCNVKDAAVRARAKQSGRETQRRWVL